MRGRPTKQGIGLWLQALVLAAALTWYAMNPASGSVRRVKRGGDQPDHKRGEADSPPGVAHRAAPREFNAPRAVATPIPPEAQDVDELEWPDVIELR